MPYNIVILIINAVISANQRCGVWYTDVKLVRRSGRLNAPLIRSLLSLERILCISNLLTGTMGSLSKISWLALIMTSRIQAIGISIYAERICISSL